MPNLVTPCGKKMTMTEFVTRHLVRCPRCLEWWAARKPS